MPDQPSKESLGMSQHPYQARNIDTAETGGQPVAQMRSDFDAPMELVDSAEIEWLRQQNTALVEALRECFDVMPWTSAHEKSPDMWTCAFCRGFMQHDAACLFARVRGLLVPYAPADAPEKEPR